MQKCHFIFFGRLSKEKGADILLECLQNIIQSDRHEKLQIDIFGSGHYEQEYKRRSDKGSLIHYHGRQPFENIKKQLKKSDYSIMPSIFLETFGLSALESLSEGVPVIGIKKGWLTPFILDELSIGDENSSRTESWDNLYAIIKHCSTEKQKEQNWTEKENKDKHRIKQAKQTAEQYNSKNRITRFKSLSKRKTLSGKKVLLVSDYKTELGGIETYLYKVKKLLEQEGVSVKTIGANISKRKIGTLKRRALFFLSSYNIFFKHKLTNIIKKEKPDLVRYHSVLRHIGHQGIINKKDIPANSQTRLMYHDLGYFTAFPSNISFTNQIPQNLSRKEFFNKHKQASNNNSDQQQNGIKKFITTLALRHKHRLLKKLHKQIEKNIDLQLIPSDYLKPHIRNIHQTAKIETLAHFLENWQKSEKNRKKVGNKTRRKR